MKVHTWQSTVARAHLVELLAQYRQLVGQRLPGGRPRPAPECRGVHVHGGGEGVVHRPDAGDDVTTLVRLDGLPEGCLRPVPVEAVPPVRHREHEGSTVGGDLGEVAQPADDVRDVLDHV